MSENTPLLDHHEHQQAEALDFMAWQQQMETGQLAAQASPDVIISQPEVEQPASIMDQHGDTVVTIYGVTGTLRDLTADGGGCPYPKELRTFEANERFAVKILEKNGIAIPDTHAHLRSEQPKQKAEAAEADRRKDIATKVETTKTGLETTVSDRAVETTPQAIEIVAENQILGIIAEQIEPDQDNQTEKISESTQRIEEAPVTAGGGPDLNELIKETVDSLDAPHLPSVAILRKRILDLGPISLVSTTATAANQAENSVIVSMDQDEVLEVSGASFDEQMVELYLEAAKEVTSDVAERTDTEITHEAITDEMIADFLGLTYFEQTEQPNDSFELPAIATEATLNTLSNISNLETTQPLDGEPALVLQVLPVQIAAAYHEMIAELEPEAAEQLVELVEVMSLIAERLQVLESNNQAEGQEGQQIAEVLVAYYDQLVEALRIPADPEARKVFIAEIRANIFRRTLAQTFKIPLEGTREFDRDMIKQALMSQGRHQPSDRRPVNLARIFAMLGIRHNLQDA